MSDRYPGYNYQAMDPKLPIPPRGATSDSSSSPRTKTKDKARKMSDTELLNMNVIVPPSTALPTGSRRGNGTTYGTNYDNRVPGLVITPPQDSVADTPLPLPPSPRFDTDDDDDDDEEEDDGYDDAVSMSRIDVETGSSSGHTNMGPLARHMQRKVSKKSDTNYIKLKNQDTAKREWNEKLSRSVARKDMNTIARDIEDNPSLAVSSDQLGVSALEKVVVSGNILLVDVFISALKGVTVVLDVIDHAILYAIRENNLAMVKHLVEQRDRFQLASKENDNVVCIGAMEESEKKQKKQDVSAGAASGPTSAPSVTSITSGSSTASSGTHLRFSMAGKAITKIKHKMSAAGNSMQGTWAKRQQRELPGFEDAEFSSFITPIVLAAKLDRLEIVQYLIVSDHCEIHPLTVECPFPPSAVSGELACEVCNVNNLLMSSNRSVEDSMRILEIYRALASPAFIFSTTEDPVLEAFKISEVMHQTQNEDKAFKQEYDEINEQVRKFARDLLHLCRSTLEIKTMLAEEKAVETVNTEGRMASYPRILLALYYKQKEFVAHPHCQQIMAQVWHERLPAWVCNSSSYSWKSLLYVLLWLVGWPFLCLGFIFKLHPRLIQFMKGPYNRMISDNISYAIFLSLLIANAVTSEGYQDTQGQIFTPVEFLIMIWVIGMTARMMKMAWRRRNLLCCNMCSRSKQPAGTKEWRFYDTTLVSCFWVWCGLRVICMIIYRDSKELPRYEWESGHMFLVAEAFYAVGVIFSIARLNVLMQVNSSLGPLQISLTKMVEDIIRFCVIFFIVISAFVLAITKLYSSYENARSEVNGEEPREQLDLFIGFKKTYKNLFWSLFEYPDVLEGARIVVDNTKLNDTAQYQRHDFTEFFGLFLIGAYHCVAGIVMLNMLIAMMANSYNTIAHNSDMEWKFARTRLRMMYHNEVGSLPPPFNILIIGSLIKWLQQGCAKCSSCCDSCLFHPSGKVKCCSYKKLVKRLYKRYWNREMSYKYAKKEELQKLFEQYVVHNSRPSSPLASP